MEALNGHTTDAPCSDCDVGPFARNHYFTGKLLVERDFTDEQRYYVDKLRHHHQRLHGWGVVCGLRVVPHENPACRDRLVCVEPGTAIDCCGHELLVREEDCIDLMQFEAFRRLVEAADLDAPDPDVGTEAPTLQLCIRYRECPTEEVPVLYDECGCDDTQCAPNRILESYDFDLRIDPEPATPPDPAGVEIAWAHTLAVARAHRVAYDATSERVYVLTDNDPGETANLIAFSAATHSILHADALDGEVMDLALAPDGSHVYVSLRSSSEGDPHPLRILVLNDDLSVASSGITVPGDVGKDVRLAVTAGERLYALNINEESAYAWDGTESPSASDRIGPIPVGTDPWGIVAAPDGSRVFVANSGNSTLSVIDPAGLTGASTEAELAAAVTSLPLPTGAVPYALAVADTTDGMRLFVADRSGGVYILAIRPGDLEPYPVLGSVGVPDEPLDLVASAGGHWIYALLHDATGDGHVQVIDAHRVEADEAGALGASVPVGDALRALALTTAEDRLYAAYHGTEEGGSDGGVAVLDVTMGACDSLFERALDGCPDCDDPDCLVLATITDWVPGTAITDDQIDNLTDRRLLPSTSLLTEVIRCLLEREGGNGTPGEQGPPGLPGEPGEPGLGIDEVDITIVECEDPGSATIQEISGVRTLMLKIPRGCDGEDGEGGAGIDDAEITLVPCGEPGSATIVETEEGRILELTIPSACNPDLAHICAVSWKHAGRLSFSDFVERGLVIAFDRDVVNEDIHRHSVRVLAGRRDDETGVVCWCEVEARTLCGVQLDKPCEIGVPDEDSCVDNFGVNGLWFLPDQRGVQRETEYRVVVQGDFIRKVDAGDTPGRALDGDHLPPWLPNRRSGDGVEGGTFESWFYLGEQGGQGRLDLNLATMDELRAIGGIGRATASAILKTRPFASLDDFRARIRPTSTNWDLMRSHVAVTPTEK